MPLSGIVPGVHSLTAEEVAAGLLAGDAEIWGLVPVSWLEPALAACQAYHVADAIPESVDDLWPYLFTWPASDPEATGSQVWVEGPIVAGTPISWATAVQNGLSAAVYFDSGFVVQEQSKDVNGALSSWIMKQPLVADQLLWWLDPLRPRLETAPVSLPDPLTEEGFGAIGVYSRPTVITADARRFSAREALMSLLRQAVHRTGELPATWEEAQAWSGLVSIHLDPADPESCDLAIWWNEGVSYRFRVNYSGNLVEEGVLLFDETEPFASESAYVSFEASGHEPGDFTELLGAWTLGDPDPVEQPRSHR